MLGVLDVRGYIDPEGNSINLPDVYRHSRHVGE